MDRTCRATSAIRMCRASSSRPDRSAMGSASAPAWRCSFVAWAAASASSCCSATANATKGRTGKRRCLPRTIASPISVRSSIITSSRASRPSRTRLRWSRSRTNGERSAGPSSASTATIIAPCAPRSMGGRSRIGRPLSSPTRSRGAAYPSWSTRCCGITAARRAPSWKPRCWSSAAARSSRMRDAFVRALGESAARDPRVMLVNGDLGFGVLTDFIARFPDNYVNAGVAEQNMTAVACGMALAGARAYTYSIGNFPTLRCLEQIRNDVCYHRADVTVVSIGAGFSYGQLGVSHFATEDLAVQRAITELTVVSPSEPWQAYSLTHQLHALGGPSYLRLDKASAGLSEAPIEIGKARTVRDGCDAVIFATGSILGEALAAAHDLADERRSIRVVDIHTLKPFDAETVCEAAQACG